MVLPFRLLLLFILFHSFHFVSFCSSPFILQCWLLFFHHTFVRTHIRSKYTQISQCNHRVVVASINWGAKCLTTKLVNSLFQIWVLQMKNSILFYSMMTVTVISPDDKKIHVKLQSTIGKYLDNRANAILKEICICIRFRDVYNFKLHEL